jgi:uncharacterized protein
MPLIRETIVTTCDASGRVHLAPLGIIADGDSWIIAPFRPSTTLENLRVVPYAVANATDDVRLFAGCLTGRRDWPTVPARNVPVPRFAGALAHTELAVKGVTEDEQRPRFHCRVVARESHAPFEGFNRAQAAVVEAAILFSRLALLPREQIERDIARLKITIDKTAGDIEREAWGWLMEGLRVHDTGQRTAAPPR